MTFVLPPALLLIAGAIAIALLPRGARNLATVLTPLLTLAYAVAFLPSGTTLPYGFLNVTLEVVRSDRLALLFGGAFCVTSAIAALYAWHESDVKQQMTGLLYTAGAVGVVFAGDLLTFYAFWELLAVAATALVWSGGTTAAARAGMRYLLMHLTGGAILLAGIVLHVRTSGSIHFGAFDPSATTLGSWLILVGFCLNAAVPPLHAWVPDAYPRATVAGSVFLAALTTKTAVYALLRGFAGWEILVAAGVAMALYGVLYAILATDLRLLLAYHIISQIGYMLVGIGVGTELAIDGAAAHAINNLLYKGLLFMAAGAVIVTTGRDNLADLGGLRTRQPLVFALYVIGALSICGVPLWNGFLSKGMVLSASGAAHHEIAFLLLTLASVGTFASVGLKLPYFTWLGPDRGIEPAPAPTSMLAAMGIAAALCTALGFAPGLLYGVLPHASAYDAFTASHVFEVVQLLGFTFFAFALLLPNLSVARKTLLDVDALYRSATPALRAILVTGTDRIYDAVQALADRIQRGAVQALRDPTAWLASGPRPHGDFDPDRIRPPLLSPLLVTLATFVLIAIALLSWAGGR